MGKELQMPQRGIKTHRFYVERRELEEVFPSFSILFSGGKNAIRKNTQHKMGQLCPPKEIHLRALLETQEGLFGAGIPQNTAAPFLNSHPAQLHCKVK